MSSSGDEDISLPCACDEKNSDYAEKDILEEREEQISSSSSIEENNENLWQNILREYEEKRLLYNTLREKKEALSRIEIPYEDVPSTYLEREIFPLLLSAMEQMLIEATRWNVLRVQKSRFNGLDYLAEILWNRNSRHPGRDSNWVEVFDIPQFKLILRMHPRPIYPKSWLWSKEEGALHIQRHVRGWLVRKREDVQEMRQFWKAIKKEKMELQKRLESMEDDEKTLEEINLCEFYKLFKKHGRVQADF